MNHNRDPPSRGSEYLQPSGYLFLTSTATRTATSNSTTPPKKRVTFRARSWRLRLEDRYWSVALVGSGNWPADNIRWPLIGALQLEPCCPACGNVAAGDVRLVMSPPTAGRSTKSIASPPRFPFGPAGPPNPAIDRHASLGDPARITSILAGPNCSPDTVRTYQTSGGVSSPTVGGGLAVAGITKGVPTAGDQAVTIGRQRWRRRWRRYCGLQEGPPRHLLDRQCLTATLGGYQKFRVALRTNPPLAGEKCLHVELMPVGAQKTNTHGLTDRTLLTRSVIALTTVYLPSAKS